MKMQSTYDVGIYCRLSRDDHNYSTTSMSILNQRKILKDYVQEMGWNLREIYVDDGYTGTNFDRPDFKRMIRDVELGKLNCVITKDLSRLGRNYIESGYYTDDFFLTHGVRYIALNDGIDSKEENDMMPFHHVVNEIYPKQISRKVRQVRASNAKQGKFLGSQAPYGYMKSPHDKHVLVIDTTPPAASVVKRIFAEYAHGMSARAIAMRLNDEGIDSPRFFHYAKLGRPNPLSEEKNCWGSATILQLMRNRAYIGDMVQGMRSSVSYKVKKMRAIDPEDWIVVENTHEPLIDRETWDRVQQRLGEKRIARTTSVGTIGLFAGLIRCGDCSAALSYMRRVYERKEVGVYRCSKYNNNGSKSCTSHYIHENVLMEFVLNDIRTHAQLAAGDQEELAARLLRSATQSRAGASQEIQRKLKAAQARLETINAMVKNVYEDKVAGKLPEEVFQNLLVEYGREREALEAKQPEMYKQLDKTEDSERQVYEWIKRISKHVGIDELDRETIGELIDSIIVTEGNGSDREMEITIRYRFISTFLQNAKEDIA